MQYLVTPGLVRALMTMLEHLTLPTSISAQLALGVANTPEGLLFGVVIVAMLTELRTGRMDKWIWAGWIGSSAAALTLLTSKVVYVYADSANLTEPIAPARLTVESLRLVFIGLASRLIVKRFGRGGFRLDCVRN